MVFCNTLLVAGLAFSAAATASDPSPRFELTAGGEIEIGADGQITNYRLNSALSPVVASLVERAVRGWKFEPVTVDGRAVRAKTSMRLTLSAEPVDNDQYKMRVLAADFGEPGTKRDKTKPPHYPSELVRAGVGGKVVLNAKLDSAGKVVEVYPYQTSLDVRARTEADSERFRSLLERAATTAVKSWEFELAESIDGKPRSETYVVVPLDFALFRCDRPCKPPKMDGSQWKGYIPGPIHPAPWAAAAQIASAGQLTALKDGQAHVLDSPVHLKEDVIGKAL